MTTSLKSHGTADNRPASSRFDCDLSLSFFTKTSSRALPVMDESDEGTDLRDPKRLSSKVVRASPSETEQRFAIFIDEINRGNVASIFEELIMIGGQTRRPGE